MPGHPLGRRAAMTVLGSLAAGARAAQTRPTDDPWPSLSEQIFGGRPIAADHPAIAIDAPYRAEDAAVVPITLRVVPPDGPSPTAVTLVIDENPSPLAAKFTLGETAFVHMIATRVRIDSYTNIHAVAEMSGGALRGSTRFVKAAGGCSAPAAKQEGSTIPIGTMRFRQFPPGESDAQRQAELLIRHPNFTGMQMDQVTRLYVPAHFVTAVTIWQDDDLILAVESGISIAENPAFRFGYRPNGAREIRTEIKDSEGKVVQASWPATPA